jgi:hypothetical protein
MKLASITAAAVAALVMTAVSTPADACRWKKAGYHGYRTADAGGEVRGWKHRRHWKHHKRWRHDMK